MKKIDRRIHYLVGIDTETCNTQEVNGKFDFSRSLVYDVGWVVTDKRGRIYKEHSFIVAEIFYGRKDLMKSCYYKEKISLYEKDIKEGKRIVKSFFEIWNLFKKEVALYKIDTIFAHNSFFDYTVLNNTLSYVYQTKKYFTSYNMIWWDTVRMAQNAVGIQKTYQRFCEKYGYLTNQSIPKPRFTAEILYRYITKNNDFIENHTGLEDIKIEVVILAYCFRQKKKMRKELFNRQYEQLHTYCTN